MLASQIPVKLTLPFANAGNKNTIPAASQIGTTPGAASLTDGFPPLTFTPDWAGGIPPSGADMNGILYDVSAWVRWQSAGGQIAYDATFQTAIGGYPQGAYVSSLAVINRFWVSLVDNNTTNPDAAGAGWLSTEARVFSIAGTPNGLVAGNAGVPGLSPPDFCVNTITGFIATCITTGSASTAVWTTPINVSALYDVAYFLGLSI